VYVLAHIGNIPIEEWAPFVVPVLALYLYGRRKDRRHRKAVQRLPDASEALDERTITLVEDRWTNANHRDLSRAHLPLLYPPGPDGLTAHELARRTHADAANVERLLLELEDLGYLNIDDTNDSDQPRVWLTLKGHDVFYETETALLSASAN
jgi:hypothetical protein